LTVSRGEDKEISVLDLLKSIWSGRIFILKGAILFLLIGIVVAFTTPREWRASTKIIINSSSSGSSVNNSLSSLAGLAGISIPNQQSSKVNPLLLEHIVNEDSFIEILMRQNFYYEEIGDSISFEDYCYIYMGRSLLQKVKSLPGSIVGLVRGEKSETPRKVTNDSYLFISSDKEKLYDGIKSRITVVPDVQSGITQVSVLMQDPFMSAQTTEFTRNYIEAYMIELITREDRSLLVFVKGQLDEKRSVFLTAQNKLSTFRDENIRLVTNASRAEEQRIQNEYDVAYQLYLSMEKAYADVQIQLEKKLPLFQDLSKITVPTEVVKPKKMVMLFGFLIVGALVASLFLIIKLQITQPDSQHT
jgi:hypothetical protein